MKGKIINIGVVVILISCASQSVDNKQIQSERAKSNVDNKIAALASYFQYVAFPVNEGNSVNLENEKYILIYKPDNVYSLVDKKTELTNEGRYDPFIRNTGVRFLEDRWGKVFLLEIDIATMSRQQFLSSNYIESAQTVLIPIKSTEKEVVYQYERPLDLKGTEISFNITVIDK